MKGIDDDGNDVGELDGINKEQVSKWNYCWWVLVLFGCQTAGSRRDSVSGKLAPRCSDRSPICEHTRDLRCKGVGMRLPADGERAAAGWSWANFQIGILPNPTGTLHLNHSLIVIFHHRTFSSASIHTSLRRAEFWIVHYLFAYHRTYRIAKNGCRSFKTECTCIGNASS